MLSLAKACRVPPWHGYGSCRGRLAACPPVRCPPASERNAGCHWSRHACPACLPRRSRRRSRAPLCLPSVALAMEGHPDRSRRAGRAEGSRRGPPATATCPGVVADEAGRRVQSALRNFTRRSPESVEGAKEGRRLLRTPHSPLRTACCRLPPPWYNDSCPDRARHPRRTNRQETGVNAV